MRPSALAGAADRQQEQEDRDGDRTVAHAPRPWAAIHAEECSPITAAPASSRRAGRRS